MKTQNFPHEKNHLSKCKPNLVQLEAILPYLSFNQSSFKDSIGTFLAMTVGRQRPAEAVL